MEQRIVLQNDKKYIYFISDVNVSFYLIIPRNRNVSLLLNLIDDVSDSVIQNIVDVADKVVVAPVITKDILSRVGLNQLESFNTLDDIFSSAINLAHKILTYNGLEVDRIIYFADGTNYSVFRSWFIKKYDGRVLSFQLGTKDDFFLHIQQNNVVQPVVNNEEKKDLLDEITEESLKQDSSHESFGFVSYVLLGVVVAVVSLVFLYFIL